MDSLENALEMLSVKVESIADSSKKLTDEVKDTDININKGIREVEKCQKIFYGLTPADRDQAVYERVIPKAYRDVQFDSVYYFGFQAVYFFRETSTGA